MCVIHFINYGMMHSKLLTLLLRETIDSEHTDMYILVGKENRI